MEIKAKARYIKMSPKKVRLVVDIVRGVDIPEALAQLRFINKLAVKPVEKLLNSAVANAKHNFEIEKDNLYIKEIRVDEGPTTKRWKPRAFGRAGTIRKRSSHISVTLSAKKGVAKVKTVKKEKLAKPELVKEKKSLEIDNKIKSKKTSSTKAVAENEEKEIFDVREKGKHRHKEHLDKIREKEKGRAVKRMFRRKAG